MITPDQKAKQLVYSYMNLLRNDEGNLICNQDAAECAKLLVDEIIDNNLVEPQEKRQYINGVEPHISQLEFWMRVKKELEKY